LVSATSWTGLDEDTHWEHILSGGENAAAGVRPPSLIHRPNVIVMDEATAALDPPGQDLLMRLVMERLPEATVVSVGPSRPSSKHSTRASWY